MTWGMLRDLAAAGFEVGAHTADHLNLSATDPDEAVRQVLTSKQAVEARLGRACEFFAWPYGQASDLPPALLPLLSREFLAVFSAIRSRRGCSFDGAALDRDHFEPSWPPAHVRFFTLRGREPAAASS